MKKKISNHNKINNKLIIVWKDLASSVPFNTAKESINNIKTFEAAKKHISKRNSLNIKYATWNGHEVFSERAA